MAISIPTLDVFFIDFNQPAQKKIASGLLKAATFAIAGPLAGLAVSTGLKALGEDGPSLKRLIDEKRFNIISSNTELTEYTNANGNAWVINDKSLKARQYYVRHPKKSQQNILIEAKDFYRYIEEEQKDELIEFIMAHCPAKVIQIDRAECIEVGGNVAGNVQGADLSGGANYGKMRGNYFSLVNPNGVPRVEARENYFWIDKSIMRSIASLTEGASITQSYQSDFTFGLNLSEAKTIGLDMSMHKKFSYTIHIEC